jgi:hypothetical protein
MAQPVTEPTTAEAVKAYMQLTRSDLDAVVDSVVGAVNGYVRTLRVAQIDADAWPETVAHGATMLAARLVRRRDTPAGVQAFTDEGAVYVSRNDPDVAMLLGVGAYGKPVAK